MIFWLRIKIGNVRFTFIVNVFALLVAVAATIALHLITGWNPWICALVVILCDLGSRPFRRGSRRRR